MIHTTPQNHRPQSADGNGAQLNAEIARAVVRIYRRFRGRGPTKSRALFRDDVLVVLLSDVMTVPERTLLATGDGETVTQAQQRLRSAMRAELEATIEQLTGTGVIALMSQNHRDPDMAVEVFVLERPVRPHPDLP